MPKKNFEYFEEIVWDLYEALTEVNGLFYFFRNNFHALGYAVNEYPDLKDLTRVVKENHLFTIGESLSSFFNNHSDQSEINSVSNQLYAMRDKFISIQNTLGHIILFSWQNKDNHHFIETYNAYVRKYPSNPNDFSLYILTNLFSNVLQGATLDYKNVGLVDLVSLVQDATHPSAEFSKSRFEAVVYSLQQLDNLFQQSEKLNESIKKETYKRIQKLFMNAYWPLPGVLTRRQIHQTKFIAIVDELQKSFTEKHHPMIDEIWLRTNAYFEEFKALQSRKALLEAPQLCTKIDGISEKDLEALGKLKMQLQNAMSKDYILKDVEGAKIAIDCIQSLIDKYDELYKDGLSKVSGLISQFAPSSAASNAHQKKCEVMTKDTLKQCVGVLETRCNKIDEAAKLLETVNNYLSAYMRRIKPEASAPSVQADRLSQVPYEEVARKNLRWSDNLSISEKNKQTSEETQRQRSETSPAQFFPTPQSNSVDLSQEDTFRNIFKSVKEILKVKDTKVGKKFESIKREGRKKAIDVGGKIANKVAPQKRRYDSDVSTVKNQERIKLTTSITELNSSKESEEYKLKKLIDTIANSYWASYGVRLRKGKDSMFQAGQLERVCFASIEQMANELVNQDKFEDLSNQAMTVYLQMLQGIKEDTVLDSDPDCIVIDAIKSEKYKIVVDNNGNLTLQEAEAASEEDKEPEHASHSASFQ